MPSINLLPKDFKSNNRGSQKQSNKLVLIISILLVVISVVFFAGLYFLNKNSAKEIESLNQEVKMAKEGIEKEFSNTELLLSNSDVDNAILLLSERVYFTKIINIFQNNLGADVYLNSLDINFDKENFLISEFEGVSKDYTSLISQIYIFKNNDIFEEIDIKDISVNKESGFIDFTGSLKFKQSSFFYGKQS